MNANALVPLRSHRYLIIRGMQKSADLTRCQGLEQMLPVDNQFRISSVLVSAGW